LASDAEIEQQDQEVDHEDIEVNVAEDQDMEQDDE